MVSMGVAGFELFELRAGRGYLLAAIHAKCSGVRLRGLQHASFEAAQMPR
jgi:hypothetical protein